MIFPATLRPDRSRARCAFVGEFASAKLQVCDFSRGLIPDPKGHSAGVAVFRGGLKKGSGTTVAFAVCLTASTVNSIPSSAPGGAHSLSTLARAIIFFSVGDQVVEVALPICVRPLYTGVAMREAVLGTWGA